MKSENDDLSVIKLIEEKIHYKMKELSYDEFTYPSSFGILRTKIGYAVNAISNAKK